MRSRAARRSALPVVALALALAGCGGDDGDGAAAGGGADATGEVIVDLQEQNGSGQTGTATFTPSGDGTMVVVETVSYLVDPQPVAMHGGTCAAPGMLVHELATIEDGISVTTLDTGLGDLRAGAFAVVVAKSRTQPDARVACGELG